jgi:hypothetical protein
MKKQVGEIYYENNVIIVDIIKPKGRGRIQVPIRADDFFQYLDYKYRSK